MDMENKSEIESLSKQSDSSQSNEDNQENRLDSEEELSEAELEEIYKDLPKKEREKLETLIARREVFSGPLPHPQILREYEDILPGSADRIFKMTESQISHRQSLEKTTVDSNTGDSRLGVLFAGLIGVAGLVMGGLLVLNGNTVSGLVFGGAPLASLVGVYLKGTSLNKEDIETKDNVDSEDEKNTQEDV